ncbi:hypothetical protein THAOC_18656, partial [Thalassiosira oceanica]
MCTVQAIVCTQLMAAVSRHHKGNAKNPPQPVVATFSRKTLCNLVNAPINGDGIWLGGSATLGSETTNVAAMPSRRLDRNDDAPTDGSGSGLSGDIALNQLEPNRFGHVLLSDPIPDYQRRFSGRFLAVPSPCHAESDVGHIEAPLHVYDCLNVRFIRECSWRRQRGAKERAFRRRRGGRREAAAAGQQGACPSSTFFHRRRRRGGDSMMYDDVAAVQAACKVSAPSHQPSKGVSRPPGASGRLPSSIRGSYLCLVLYLTSSYSTSRSVRQGAQSPPRRVLVLRLEVIKPVPHPAVRVGDCVQGGSRSFPADDGDTLPRSSFAVAPGSSSSPTRPARTDADPSRGGRGGLGVGEGRRSRPPRTSPGAGGRRGLQGGRAGPPTPRSIKSRGAIGVFLNNGPPAATIEPADILVGDQAARRDDRPGALDARAAPGRAVRPDHDA